MAKKEIIERSVKQLNTYGNGIGVLVTREAKKIKLKLKEKKDLSAEGKGMLVMIEAIEKILGKKL